MIALERHSRELHIFPVGVRGRPRPAELTTYSESFDFAQGRSDLTIPVH
jgi:hypothetical protein